MTIFCNIKIVLFFLDNTKILEGPTPLNFEIVFSVKPTNNSYSGQAIAPHEHFNEDVKDSYLDVYKIVIKDRLVAVKMFINFTYVEPKKQLLVS